jgi:hypothetical protein
MPRSNQKEPLDPGAAVYWKDGQQERCMAIDRYTSVADNLAAIAATIEAMRAIERHGGAEILNRAFTGFSALPPKPEQSWRYYLGFGEDQRVTVDQVDAAFRELAKTRHPDKGGDPEAFKDISGAREAAKRELAGVA